MTDSKQTTQSETNTVGHGSSAWTLFVAKAISQDMYSDEVDAICGSYDSGLQGQKALAKLYREFVGLHESNEKRVYERDPAQFKVHRPLGSKYKNPIRLYVDGGRIRGGCCRMRVTTRIESQSNAGASDVMMFESTTLSTTSIRPLTPNSNNPADAKNPTTTSPRSAALDNLPTPRGRTSPKTIDEARARCCFCVWQKENATNEYWMDWNRLIELTKPTTDEQTRCQVLLAFYNAKLRPYVKDQPTKTLLDVVMHLSHADS
jgi:hypothetical protein